MTKNKSTQITLVSICLIALFLLALPCCFYTINTAAAIEIEQLDNETAKNAFVEALYNTFGTKTAFSYQCTSDIINIDQIIKVDKSKTSPVLYIKDNLSNSYLEKYFYDTEYGPKEKQVNSNQAVENPNLLYELSYNTYYNAIYTNSTPEGIVTHYMEMDLAEFRADYLYNSINTTFSGTHNGDNVTIRIETNSTEIDDDYNSIQHKKSYDVQINNNKVTNITGIMKKISSTRTVMFNMTIEFLDSYFYLTIPDGSFHTSSYL